jgi:hypothetical protein
MISQIWPNPLLACVKKVHPHRRVPMATVEIRQSPIRDGAVRSRKRNPSSTCQSYSDILEHGESNQSFKKVP